MYVIVSGEKTQERKPVEFMWRMPVCRGVEKEGEGPTSTKPRGKPRTQDPGPRSQARGENGQLGIYVPTYV